MATKEYKAVLSVDVKDTPKTMRDLKNQIKELKEKLDGLNLAEEDYAKTLDQLHEAQTLQRNAMHATATSFEEVEKASKGLGDSYNALVARMAKLKEEWRSTSDAARRAELGEQINGINDQLKELDASTGNFGRNVGDYANQMGQAFQATAGAAGSVINPIKGMTAGFKALSATPVIAILGLVVNLIFKVGDAMKSSQQNMEDTSDAFAIFNAIADVTKVVLQWLGKGFALVAKYVTGLLKSIGLLNDRIDDNIQITREQMALEVAHNEERKNSAKLEYEISELKLKAAQKDKFTHKERIAFLKEAFEKEESIAKKRVELAEREFELQKLMSKQADNSFEENKNLAEAEAKVWEERKRLKEKQRELASQLVEAINADNAERAKAVKIEKAQTASTKDVTHAAKEEVVAVEDVAKAYDKQNKARAKAFQEKLSDIEYEEEIAEARLGLLEKPEDMSDVEFEQMKEEMLYEIHRKALEDTIALKEEELAYYRDNELPEGLTDEERLEALAERGEQEKQLMQDIERAKTQLAVAEIQKRDKDDKEAAEARKARLKGYLQATANSLNALAALSEAFAGKNKALAKVAQGLRVAETIVNTYKGATEAYNAYAGIPFVGPVLGASAAAVVVANGISNIAKMKSVNMDNPSTNVSVSSAPSLAGATVAPPSVESGDDFQRRPQEEPTPTAQRVYILSSDLQQNAQEVEILNGETTF